MASANTLCKKILNVKDAEVTGAKFLKIRIKIRLIVRKAYDLSEHGKFDRYGIPGMLRFDGSTS